MRMAADSVQKWFIDTCVVMCLATATRPELHQIRQPRLRAIGIHGRCRRVARRESYDTLVVHPSAEQKKGLAIVPVLSSPPAASLTHPKQGLALQGKNSPKLAFMAAAAASAWARRLLSTSARHACADSGKMVQDASKRPKDLLALPFQDLSKVVGGTGRARSLRPFLHARLD